jgi:N-acylneuraminate cytidylyltransferase
MKVGALIPCRTGSRRVPGKNFRDFCGKPLWKWTHEQALGADLFERIIVSSDARVGNSNDGITLYDDFRPAELCSDEATQEDVMAHYSALHPEIDIWCLLQPTSPLRLSSDITGAFKMLIDDKRDSVVSVFKDPLLFWVRDAVLIQDMYCPIASFHTDKRPNSQDRGDWLKENGAVYFTPSYTLKSTNSRCGGRVGLYEMPKERSIEIDDEYDWKIAEMLMKERLNIKEAA